MFIVVQTLRLLLVISKSSRYITQHVQQIEKRLLYMKLTANAEVLILLVISIIFFCLVLEWQIVYTKNE